MATGLTKDAGWEIGVSRTRRTTGSPARSALRFHQERMSGAAERERRRAHWQGVMDAVAAALDRRG